MLIDVTVRLGFIGLVLFLWIILTFVRMSWQAIRWPRDPSIRQGAFYVTLAFVSYFIIGIAEPVFLFSASAMPFYILMGMMTILWQLNREGASVIGG